MPAIKPDKDEAKMLPNFQSNFFLSLEMKSLDVFFINIYYIFNINYIITFLLKNTKKIVN
jgi:hypothetical protein